MPRGKENETMTNDELLAMEDDLRAYLMVNFRDDLLYPDVFWGRGDKLYIHLLPLPYECDSCRVKGFFPRLVEAFKQRINPTWCNECCDKTGLRIQRQKELTPRLLELLEAEFVTDLTLPGNPFSLFAVSRKRA